MKISIVMTYYKRAHQLMRTLNSLEESKHKDFNVIIVDDASEEELIIPKMLFSIDTITIKKEDKTWNNPEPAYNMGILKAIREYQPEAIIIQNAECMHIGDILSYTEDNIKDDNYISFACIALDYNTTFNESIDILSIADNCKTEATAEGQMAWYNHPVYRPCELDFCAAISTYNMKRINGYDERFMYGMAYGDNYLRYRIKTLGLKFETPTHPIVAHQWHYSEWYWKKRNYGLMNKNNILFNQLTKENNFRAEHIITPDFEDTVD